MGGGQGIQEQLQNSTVWKKPEQTGFVCFRPPADGKRVTRNGNASSTWSLAFPPSKPRGFPFSLAFQLVALFRQPKSFASGNTIRLSSGDADPLNGCDDRTLVDERSNSMEWKKHTS